MADSEDLEALHRGDVDLVQRDFRDAHLQDTDLSHRDLRGAHLERANLTRARLVSADITQARLLNFTAQEANLSGLQATSTVFHTTDLRSSSLRGANLSRSHFTKSNLDFCDLRGANFSNCVFNEGTSFESAVTDNDTIFDGATIFRPLARQPAFRFYRVERGKLVRKSEPLTDAEPAVAMKAEAVRSIVQVRETLRAAASEPPPGSPSEIGIGHNKPPLEAALSLAESADTLAALDDLELQLEKDQPDHKIVSDRTNRLKEIAEKTGKWLAEKADIFAEEFSKSLGNETGKIKTWVGLRLIFNGSLLQLLDKIYSLVS